ncbi:hypothetical protein F5051DRAFT_455751 [Lentinula edodes]|nr:hypothetical protein F5051DRAFT_455751 [Lentinula edodes]
MHKMLPRTLLRRSVANKLRGQPIYKGTHSLHPAPASPPPPPQLSSGRPNMWILLATGMTGGVIGGLAVFGAGYTYYHFSGIKRAVDVSKQFRVYLEQTKQSIVNKHSNEIGRLGAKASGPLLQQVISRLPDKAYLAEKADQSVGLLKGFLGKGKD